MWEKTRLPSLGHHVDVSVPATGLKCWLCLDSFSLSLAGKVTWRLALGLDYSGVSIIMQGLGSAKSAKGKKKLIVSL